MARTKDVERAGLLDRLYRENCNCGGPQPSYYDPKLDQHRPDCNYMIAVEAEEIRRKEINFDVR